MKSANSLSIQKYEELFKVDTTPAVSVPLCEAYLQDSEIKKALSICEISLKDHPQNLPLQTHYAYCLIHMDQREKAKDILLNILEKKPHHLKALNIYGEYCILQKDSPKTLQTFKKILFLDPTNKRAQKVTQTLEVLESPLYSFQSSQEKTYKSFQKLEDAISILDALIAKNQLNEALDFLDKVEAHHHNKEALEKRRSLIQQQKLLLAENTPHEEVSTKDLFDESSFNKIEEDESSFKEPLSPLDQMMAEEQEPQMMSQESASLDQMMVEEQSPQMMNQESASLDQMMAEEQEPQMMSEEPLSANTTVKQPPMEQTSEASEKKKQILDRKIHLLKEVLDKIGEKNSCA